MNQVSAKAGGLARPRRLRREERLRLGPARVAPGAGPPAVRAEPGLLRPGRRRRAEARLRGGGPIFRKFNNLYGEDQN